MKKYILTSKILALLILFSACSKTTILDQTPQDKYPDEALWTDINLADAYLVDTYLGTGIGFYQEMLTSLTDESYNFQGSEVYATGNVSPDNSVVLGAGFPTWSNFYSTIQKLNVFLSKIDQIAGAYPAEQQPAIKMQTDVMRGEAIFLRAYCYSRLALDYGGLPLIKEPVELGDDLSSLERTPFAEIVDFISAECDAAAALLPGPDGILQGRATKGAALAIKSRVLLFAASDLTADGSSTNENVAYVGGDRISLWTKAKNAARAVIDLGIYQLADFGAPDKTEVAKNYFNFFKAKDLSNPEVIWGKKYSKTVGQINQMNLWNGSNGMNNWGSNNPTQNLVDDYQMEDGSDFSDHFEVNGSGVYRNISSKYTNPNIYSSRDPRFYGSILYDSSIWQKRFANLAGVDPLGIYDRRTRISIINGVQTESFGIDTRQGSIETWNAGYTGYLMKKMLDDGINGRSENNDNVWIEFRYAEILLNYAEACIGLGEIPEATTYINMIRNRAGLPDFTGDLTQALRYEREVELVFEGSRWYDIRRWKMLEESLTDALGIEITETNTNGVKQTVWKQIVAQQRGSVDPKMYWLPIMTDEVQKDPALDQNPGY